tara:strand:+ start:2133 stop:2480 length:348 start_codon:yes stop_codon:yes gene_type:complete
MAISKMHPIANWLRCSGNTYHRTWDRVCQLRDAEYAAGNMASGLPSGAKDWFFTKQLPELIKDDFYRKQTEVRIKELDKKATQIEKEVKPLIDSKLKEQSALIEEREILVGLLNG